MSADDNLLDLAREQVDATRELTEAVQALTSTLGVIAEHFGVGNTIAYRRKLERANRVRSARRDFESWNNRSRTDGDN
ncbi:hypothetical protein [Rhodococcus pyridinivorans]|uniref:Uncharacterized protein n=1 Tax=Rhodococcus pyridinivorans AK37 TaxID=1114960 RepID=H0JL71_9NOCA|nr:hypothetical protein [Rhodococcus pyridinivorans]EHK86406.1 hypothetical protein AK37_01622 [Rhodococcus pyridinivorans AK37]MCD2139503.1 hypothetical protein [Rhodococcus pyridinivorans]